MLQCYKTINTTKERPARLSSGVSRHSGTDNWKVHLQGLSDCSTPSRHEKHGGGSVLLRGCVHQLEPGEPSGRRRWAEPRSSIKTWSRAPRTPDWTKGPSNKTVSRQYRCLCTFLRVTPDSCQLGDTRRSTSFPTVLLVGNKVFKPLFHIILYLCILDVFV